MLVATADRRVKTLGKLDGGFNCTANNNAGAIQQDWKLWRFDNKVCDASLTASSPPEGRSNSTMAGKLNINHLRPKIAWDTLIWAGAEARLACRMTRFKGFCNARWIAHLLLISHHVFEQCHLFNFLKPSLTQGLVSGLWGYQASSGVWFQ